MTAATHREFGVEQEHFIFDVNGLPPTNETIDRLYDRLIKDGFRVRAVSPGGLVLAVERLTDDGPLVITNDSCTHIIETAFPKMQCLSRFRDLYEATWNLLRSHLSVFGLAITFGGILEKEPCIIYWRPGEKDPTGDRLRPFLERLSIDHPLFCRNLPSCVAATQVSLSIPELEAIRKLTHFYSFEYLVPISFSNGSCFQGTTAHCIRPLALSANFHQPYPLLGIPKTIPTTLEEYDGLRAQCSGRDYSFVAIRDANRLEFRSACSQDTVDDVLRLIRFRLDIDLRYCEPNTIQTDRIHEAFHAACLTGRML